MRRYLLVLLSLIPGSVAILLGRTVIGFVLMMIGFFGWDFAFLKYSGLWLGAPEWTGPVGLAGGVVATAASVIGTWIATSPARLRRRKQRVETVIRDASIAFVRNDTTAAAALVDRGLQVASDDIDLVHLAWQIALAEGDERRAQQYERRLRRIDIDEKWKWELDGVSVDPAPSSETTSSSLAGTPANASDSTPPTANTEMNA